MIKDVYKDITVLISEQFLNQVNFLHSKVDKNTEWCAITHYEIVEKDEDFVLNSKKVTFRLLNLYLMDIGSAVYTETLKAEFLEKSKEINEFFHPGFDDFDPPELYTGFIHSHHNMATGFS